MPAPSQHAFSEKVALITDGSNPIGRAVAMQLALYGCYVIVGFRATTTEESKGVLDELKSLGTLANAVETDISSTKGVKKLIDEVDRSYGRLDLLVNCLKFNGDSEFENTSEEGFDLVLNSNLKSAYFVIQEAMRLMKPRPKPKIVNVVSACNSESTKRNSAFVAANSAMIGLTESLAISLPENFRTNAVAVSEIEKTIPERLDDKLFRKQKGPDPDDIARAIVYLLSSEAFGVNGQILKLE